MKNFFKSDFLKIFLALFFIASGVWVLNFVSAGSLISSAVSAFMSPVQQIANSVSKLATESLKRKETEENYKKQINNLKEEVRKLRTITADYYDTKRENAQFLKFYKIKKQDQSLEFKVTTIESKDPTDMFGGFLINKGSSSGIIKNATVMTESGIVGRVAQVAQNNSKVVTIFSPDFKASAVSANAGESGMGIISGNARLFKENLVGMFYLSAQNNIKPDDIIVTTGKGRVYPKNIPVGKVKEIKQDSFDSSFYATVEPFCELKNLSEVFVITNFLGKEK